MSKTIKHPPKLPIRSLSIRNCLRKRQLVIALEIEPEYTVESHEDDPKKIDQNDKKIRTSAQLLSFLTKEPGTFIKFH